MTQRCDAGAPVGWHREVGYPEGTNVTQNEPGYEVVATDELARLRRIEEAAREVLSEWRPRRSTTPLLTAIATLRAALKEKPS
jgi:hypothetical protein